MNNETKEIFIKDAEAENLVLQEKKPSTSKVLYEDISKRGKNTKHFRLQNGNFMAVMYDHPVHKLDSKTGKYIDIASELNETDSDYETIMDDFKVRMPKKDGEGRFVTVEKNGREVSWKFIPKNTSRRNKSMAAFSRRPKQDPWDIGNYPSVKYQKVDTDTDLQYDVSEDGLKEAIVLSKNPECKTFSFQMKFKGLVPMLSEDKKTVFLFRDDEEIGTELPEMKIPPAFMEDSNEAFCDEIHYEIRKSNNETFLDLVLDTDWLSEPEREYPVVIDPRVVIPRYSDSTLKLMELRSDGTRVAVTNPSTARRIGIDDSGIIHRLYFGFGLPELADGFKITKAGLLLHQKAYVSSNYNLEEYTIAPVFDPDGKTLSVDSFTWSNVRSLRMGTTIDTLVGHYRHSNTEIEIDMTSTVSDWYDPNETFEKSRCIVIKKKSEEPCCCNDCCLTNYIDFYSLYSDYSYRPKMYIEYSSTDMYSDHQKFHTFENGRSGTGSINLFTGKMSFVHGDVMAEGVKLPLAISHVYRHEYVNEDGSETNKYGKGWKLSVEQTLEIINKHGIMAVYTDAQGKRHYFMSPGTNSTAEITDDAGLGLTYKEECNCICGHLTTHVLTDEKGNKMTFNSNGKLIQLIDNNGNVSCLKYTDGRLTSVIDGTNHSAQLYYDFQGKLKKIVDNGDHDRAILYDYNAAGELVTITYPSAELAYDNEGVLQTSFIYGTNSRLERVIDYTGITYDINYDNSGRVSKLSCSGNKIIADNSVTTTDIVSEGSISFEYRAKSTAVVDDRTKVKTVYKFDSCGREISSYQDMTSVADSSKISESTLAELTGYKSITDNLESSRIGKYRSLSVTLNNAPSEEKNLLKNGFFTQTNVSTTPSYWDTVGSGTIESESYIPGKASYCFTSDDYLEYLSQTVELCDCNLDGNMLVASAWAKASGNVSGELDNTSARFRLCLEVAYEDGTTEEYYENYDNGYDGWQYAAIPFVLENGCIPISVTVKLDYSRNMGTCYFTNARLVTANGTTTTNTYRTDETPINYINVFDEIKDIKTKTTKKDSVQTTVDYIDDNSDVVRTTIIDKSGRNFTTDYKYDSKHNVIKTQDYRGLVIEYTYNSYGKELTRKTYHKDTPNAYMFSEHVYEDGNFMKSESDPRYILNGQKLKTTYEHDTSRNLLLKQTAVNGQEYNYSYDDTTDDLKSLSSVTDNKTNENQFFYTRGYLTRVAHNGFNFGFAFDQLGRSKSVTVGDGSVSTALLTNSYQKSGVNDITETVYASGEKNKVTTDIFGNPVISTYTDKNGVTRTISNATYDSLGKVKQLVDNERGVSYNYTYDNKGNLIKVVEANVTTGAVIATNTFVFDSNERLTATTYSAVGQTYSPIYEENENGKIYPDNEVVGITLNGKYTDKVTKDGLRRAQRKTFSIGTRTLFDESYGYLSTLNNGKTIETEMVSSVSSNVYGTNASSETLNYTYDKAGNLETVSRGNTLIAKYYYDGLNRLKREDNHANGRTYVWDYDVGGNILFKKEYNICTDVNLGTCLNTKNYTYKSEGWRDRLDTFNGQSCTYDSMGNPITYLGHQLEWTKVRRLAKFDSNTFKYGANGIRYQKNNTVYTINGNKILRESDGTKTITYYHGGSGIIGFEYNGTDYYFRKNLQGDVTEIYTSLGVRVASYTYDAWGKVLSVNNYTADNIGNINPIRYRGYYYDVETGLYYLNSRYYDPETGRFISADTTDVLENAKYDINGLNLYAYCNNNPVAGRDDEGDMSFWKKLAIAAAVVVAVAVVTAAVVCTAGAASGPLCVIGTVLYGAAKGAVIGAVVGAAAGAATGAVQGAVEGYRETGTLEGTLQGMGKGAIKGAVQGAQDGFISGMVSGAFAGAAMSMSGNAMFCFVAGTTVLTALGKKAIETIKVGDVIPCVDHITGEASEKRVISTTVNTVDRLVELNIDGEIIQCTETHPFQVKDKGWVDASELKPDDVVYTKDWGTATVRSVNLLELDEPVPVFNFEVEDCHTYFVGDSCILVHNAGCGQNHHFLSNKNKTYTPKFKEVTNKYDLNLNGKWNIKNLENHMGRHTDNYHKYMLKQIQNFDEIANGNKEVFLNLFEGLKDVVSTNQWIMYM